MIVNGHVCSGVAIGRRISVPTGTESECAMLNFSITNDGLNGREAEWRVEAVYSEVEAYWLFVRAAIDCSYETLTLVNDDLNTTVCYAQRYVVDDGEVNLVKIYSTEDKLRMEIYQY